MILKICGGNLGKKSLLKNKGMKILEKWEKFLFFSHIFNYFLFPDISK
jgi:hypothetical protein